MDNLIGKKLDGLYEVRELIGAGGMANVYKAVMVGQNGPVPAGTVVFIQIDGTHGNHFFNCDACLC